MGTPTDDDRDVTDGGSDSLDGSGMMAEPLDERVPVPGESGRGDCEALSARKAYPAQSATAKTAAA